MKISHIYLSFLGYRKNIYFLENDGLLFSFGFPCFFLLISYMHLDSNPWICSFCNLHFPHYAFILGTALNYNLINCIEYISRKMNWWELLRQVSECAKSKICSCKEHVNPAYSTLWVNKQSFLTKWIYTVELRISAVKFTLLLKVYAILHLFPWAYESPPSSCNSTNSNCKASYFKLSISWYMIQD